MSKELKLTISADIIENLKASGVDVEQELSAIIAKELQAEYEKYLNEEYKKSLKEEEPVIFFDDWDPQGNDTF